MIMASIPFSWEAQLPFFCYNSYMNKIVINKDKLKLIISNHRDEIGRSKQDIFTNIFSVIGFWVGTVSYFGNQSIFGMDLKTLFIVSSIVYSVWILCLIVKGCQFNADTLMDEIEKQNELSKQYSHSIVLIKNTFEKYPNKYLVYYDTRWDCWFFPNWHTMEDVQENKKNIIEHISQDLKVDRNQISISYLFSKVREKYSHSFKKSKVYDHSFYKVDIEKEELLKLKINQEVLIDGRKYKWMSIADMENSDNILKKNGDIIYFVKESGY